jgi:hypothetical protein
MFSWTGGVLKLIVFSGIVTVASPNKSGFLRVMSLSSRVSARESEMQEDSAPVSTRASTTALAVPEEIFESNVRREVWRVGSDAKNNLLDDPTSFLKWFPFQLH